MEARLSLDLFINRNDAALVTDAATAELDQPPDEILLIGATDRPLARYRRARRDQYDVATRWRYVWVSGAARMPRTVLIVND